jgi:hypothetical protein
MKGRSDVPSWGLEDEVDEAAAFAGAECLTSSDGGDAKKSEESAAGRGEEAEESAGSAGKELLSDVDEEPVEDAPSGDLEPNSGSALADVPNEKLLSEADEECGKPSNVLAAFSSVAES